jgi:hypothetical protein
LAAKLQQPKFWTPIGLMPTYICQGLQFSTKRIQFSKAVCVTQVYYILQYMYMSSSSYTPIFI